jgi:hypothetical protein
MHLSINSRGEVSGGGVEMGMARIDLGDGEGRKGRRDVGVVKVKVCWVEGPRVVEAGQTDIDIPSGRSWDAIMVYTGAVWFAGEYFGEDSSPPRCSRTV